MALSVCAAAWAGGTPTILRIGNGAEPETLDPQRSETTTSAAILRDLYEGLTSISPTGEVIPGVADHWEESADHLTFTFHIRENARWSNGDPLTAEDFVAGMRRTVDPQTASNYAQILRPIRHGAEIIEGKLPPEQLGVEAPAAHTLVIHLQAPTPYLLGLLGHNSTFPIHRPSLLAWGRDFIKPGHLVSNGAYVLQEWVPQSQITLKRNHQYWNDANTHIDTVIYYPTEDTDAEVERYRAGELDCTNTIPTTQAQWLQAHLGSEMHVAAYLGNYFMGLNVTQPPFKDNKNLRMALNMVIDRELITHKLLHDLLLPAYGWIPPGTIHYQPQEPAWRNWPLDKRIAEAQRLYAAAGYGVGHPLELELRYNTSEDNRRIATLVAAMWKQRLGVITHEINEEWKVFVQNRHLRKQTQVFRGAWIGDYNDASTFLDILRSFDGQNDQGYDSPQFDGLLAKAAQEPDIGARAALLEQAERLVEDDVPVLPIYFYTSKHLLKPRVLGWQDNVLDYHYSKDLAVQP